MELYYFTNSFPFGLGEQWKMQELEILTGYFSRITVIPFNEDGNLDNPRILNPAIEVVNPLFKSEFCKSSIGDFLTQLFITPGIIFKEIIDRKLFSKGERFSKALNFISNSRRIQKHPVFINLKKRSTPNTYWLFYWGRGSADVLPFINDFRAAKIGIRVHRYDIFEFANRGYIPFRKSLYKKVDSIFSVSDFGKHYLTKFYPQFSRKVHLARLGTKSIGLSPIKHEEVFNIVSCSAVSPVKRVSLIVEALKSIPNHKIKWTHIGSGILFNEIKEKVKELPNNIEVLLEGTIAPSEVLKIMVSRPFNIFINVSESEGVPVSIMEAFSAGIPVLATNAGGTGEIVDDQVGRLVEADLQSDKLAEYIHSFITLSEIAVSRMRANAYKRYEDRCDMDKCTKLFIEQFINE